MGRQVFRPEVGLDLDQPPAQPAPADLAEEQLAVEVGRYLESVAGEEVGAEDGLDSAEFASTPASCARRARWRRLSR